VTCQVGIIGTGFGARVHAPLLQAHPQFKVIAIASVHRNNGVRVAEELSIPRGYDDWRDMLQNEALDLVVVASNPAHHMEMTLAALSSGRHVLCEKPPALEYSQARAMLEAARRSGKVAAMNFEWRFLPERQAIKELVQSGAIGELLHVHWRESWPLWPDLRDRENSWLWQTASGGGLLGAIGSHMIDSLHYWFGALKWVQGHTEAHVFARKRGEQWEASDADDSFYFHGEFASGGTCTVQFVLAAAGLPALLEIYGTEATLVFDGQDLRIRRQKNGPFESIELPQKMDASGFAEAIRGYVHPQWKLYDALAATLSGQAVPDLPTFADSVYVQSVMDAIRDSSRMHRLPV
jgi:predicted dehydrogenase